MSFLILAIRDPLSEEGWDFKREFFILQNKLSSIAPFHKKASTLKAQTVDSDLMDSDMMGMVKSGLKGTKVKLKLKQTALVNKGLFNQEEFVTLCAGKIRRENWAFLRPPFKKIPADRKLPCQKRGFVLGFS